MRCTRHYWTMLHRNRQVPFRLRRLTVAATLLATTGCVPQNPIASSGLLKPMVANSRPVQQPLLERVEPKPHSSAQVEQLPKHPKPAIAGQKWLVKSGTINRTFSQAAHRAGLPANHIQHLQALFAEQINFRRDLRKGDHFTVILQPASDGSLQHGRLLAAELSSRGRPVRVIRHTDRHGETRFYNGKGEPLGSDFNRYPLKHPKVSSHFTLRRYHPVLKVYRPHRGTDFKAKRGTPVLATADGVVDRREHQHGYGNVIFLQHHGGQYTTVYAHLSRFAKWLKPGASVHQGDVIGYVGSSGLSTGPHLHYEFREGEEYRDAMKVVLPQKHTLSAQERKYFYQSTFALRRTLLSESSDNQLAMK